jgi:ATP-dependent RNA helicase HelY
MLYAGSPELTGLTAVVLDEIHYLAYRFRGAVWEEVILHLPAAVQVIGLSATVSNAEEFGAWLQEVRGHTAVVVDEVRPVPLWQHMMVGRRLYDLFAAGIGGTTNGGDGAAGIAGSLRIDPALERAVRDTEATAERFASARGPGRRCRSGPRRRPPSRVDVIERLDGAGLLPAITFVFSRVGCDAAVGQCVRAGLRLATDAEREQIREIVDRHTAELPEADLAVLGYWEWREALERGIAAHHAGLLPAFKETVEELFVTGLVKAVFATETLALGINMPARTVVLEKLVKFNGESHVDLTPGEYTQLTGRAGRRGIDIEGHAVVIWSPGLDPRTVGGLASKRTYPLRSSFRPSYNMAINLVSQLGRDAARTLLEQSFAQFQADRAVVGLARQVARNERAAAELAESMRCEHGDAAEYFELRSALTAAERAAATAGSARRRQAAAADLARLRRGDVINVPTGRRSGLAVVLDPGVQPDGTARPLVVTEGRWAGRLSAADFRGPVPPLGRIKLAKVTEHRVPKVRRDIASALASSGITVPTGRPRRSAGASSDAEAELVALRRAVRAHPVHGCADREEHVQWARRRQHLLTETAALNARVDAARTSLGKELDRILALLAERGYLEGEQATGPGKMLRRIWSESDLLAVECLRRGLWRDLSAAELAGVVSSLVFEARRESAIGRRPLSGRLGDAVAAVEQIWGELAGRERHHTLRVTRQPDSGFAAAVAGWARGGTLAESLAAADVGGVELSAGDFVRWCRQVIDLLDQIRVAAPDDLAPQAGRAVAALRRGVVAVGTE